MNYKNKYLKYKLKYLNLKRKLHGGMTPSTPPSMPTNNSLMSRTIVSKENILQIVSNKIKKEFSNLATTFDLIKDRISENFEKLKCLLTICENPDLTKEDKEEQIIEEIQEYFYDDIDDDDDDIDDDDDDDDNTFGNLDDIVEDVANNQDPDVHNFEIELDEHAEN